MSSGDESQACGQPRACGQPNTQEKAESEALMAIRAYWSNTDNFTPEDEAPRAESPHDQHQRMDEQRLPSVHDPNWPPPGYHAYVPRNWGPEQTTEGKGKGKANGNANGPVALQAAGKAE